MKFDFAALQKIIQEKKLSIKAPPCEMSEAQIEKLNFQLNEKKKNLDQAKSKLIGIEREIFVIKKSFQEKGTFVE